MMLMFLLGSLLLTGFFAGIEIAFISANKLSIELKKKQGKKSGITLSRFLDSPSRFIGVTLIGFNIFLVAYGFIISDMLTPLWKMSGISNVDQSGSIKLLAEIVIASIIVLLVEFFLNSIFR